MKKLIVLGAALALVGCGQSADTAGEATPSPTEMPMTPVAVQPATGDMAGKYEVTMADGTVMSETINTDGTYIDIMAGEETRGRWRMDGAKSCFDPDGDDPERCYTSEAPGADGSFVVTGPDGAKATVRKVGAAPAG